MLGRGNLVNSAANIIWDGICGEDQDGDGIVNENDDFPDDIAASVDRDRDGQPDDWNQGFGASDSTTGLTLDNDDDNDGVADGEDEFPNDPQSVDSDGDGVGDNADAYPNDSSRQALELDKALELIADEGLSACVSEQANGASFVSDISRLDCHEQVSSVEGSKTLRV